MVNITNDKQEINISRLSRGLYLLKVKLNGGERIEKLLVN
jgi:hypothetical protein